MASTCERDGLGGRAPARAQLTAFEFQRSMIEAISCMSKREASTKFKRGKKIEVLVWLVAFIAYDSFFTCSVVRGRYFKDFQAIFFKTSIGLK